MLWSALAVSTPHTGKDGRYIYTHDLWRLHEKSKVGPTGGVDPRLGGVATPLQLHAWKHRLRHHPDQDFASYILQGIEYGFRIGTDSPASLESATKNMTSAIKHPTIIDDYLKKEIDSLNILGPFPSTSAPTVHINRFGVIPKKHQPGKWRLITDLSFPEGASVNDAIDPALCSLKYISVEQVAEKAVMLGKGSLIAKIDVKSAYRLIPVSPADRHYLGTEWKGNIYVDAKLPFGLRSAPKIFNAVADALEWCLAAGGVEVVYHYLDDFAVLGPPRSEQCHQSLGLLKAICSELGIPLAPEKQAGPSTTIEFLGIIIDTSQQELRLPADKLDRLQCLTDEWSHRLRKQRDNKCRPSCTRRELESLLGMMHHASTVIPAGKAFVRQMISLINTAKQPHHHIRLNNEFISDLTWWKIFAKHWNGSSLIPGSHVKDTVLTSDASGSWGCGAWCGSEWFHLQWDDQSQRFHITIKELVPIMVALFLWGPKWRGHKVMARCDNEAVVVILNKRYSKDPHLAHMLRTLFFVEAHFQLQLKAAHIPGSHNTLADLLSRNQAARFRTIHPSADIFPSCVPLSLLQWLLDLKMDWTSEPWTQLFSTFVNRA